MRDRRGEQRALGRIVAIRAAERGALHQALLEADRAADQAADARRQADGVLRGSEEAWRDHLASGIFQPELAGGLAGELVAHANARTAAVTRERDAADLRAEREDAWHDGDARCRQSEQSLRTARRALAREREEKALETLADRVTFAWRRP